MAEIKKIRKQIHFSGRVQGVGFRYRASHAANGLGVTGWVRNNSDGTVEMEAQGTEEQINKMLVLINRGSYIMTAWILRKSRWKKGNMASMSDKPIVRLVCIIFLAVSGEKCTNCKISVLLDKMFEKMQKRW